MALSLVTTAFAVDTAQIFTLTFDNTTPHAGDTITATIYMEQAPADYYKVTSSIEYNKDILTYVSHTCSWEDMTCAVTEKRSGDYKSYVDFKIDSKRGTNTDTLNKIQTRQTGEIATVTFKVNDSCEVGQAIKYKIRGTFYDAKAMAVINNPNAEATLVVTEPGGSTITVPKTETGYSVSMAADQQVAAGDKVSIPVTVASDKVTDFNAYDMTFTYDPAALTLNTTSDSAANLTVEDNDGTVRVRRYGATQALGEALTLDFTANKAASSTVKLNAAKFDIDANSINFDAPDATVTDADTKVTGLWNVTLPAGFESTSGANTVENGGSFIFKALDTHYRYYLKITTNGSTQLVEMKKATYTIENVTDNVTVTVSDRVAKTYTLKFVVDDRFAEYFGTEPLTLADLGIENETVTVTYPNDYQFIVKFPGTGRYAGVSVEPSSNSFKSYTDRLENGDYNYVLEGSKLVGDENDVITITIGVYIKTDRDKFNILVTGDTADFDADNPRTFYSGENYTFKLNKSEYYDYEISASYKTKNLSGSTVTEYKPVKDNEDGTYTVINCPMADLTIHITKTAKAVDPSTVTVNQYVELNEKTVFLVRVAGQLSGGKVFTYDGSPMYKTTSYGYSTYSWLVIVEKGQTLTKEDVLQLIKLEDGAAAGSVGIDTDVNQSGKADVNDAQLVYDIYNRVYNDGYETVSMEKFLRADQNADGVLDSQDAVTLAGKLHV